VASRAGRSCVRAEGSGGGVGRGCAGARVRHARRPPEALPPEAVVFLRASAINWNCESAERPTSAKMGRRLNGHSFMAEGERLNGSGNSHGGAEPRRYHDRPRRGSRCRSLDSLRSLGMTRLRPLAHHDGAPSHPHPRTRAPAHPRTRARRPTGSTPTACDPTDASSAPTAAPSRAAAHRSRRCWPLRASASASPG
jgi:hypothetical protein